MENAKARLLFQERLAFSSTPHTPYTGTRSAITPQHQYETAHFKLESALGHINLTKLFQA